MKVHKFDSLSFLAGLVITGIGLIFLLPPEISDIVDVLTSAGTWFWPALFIAIGIAVMAPMISGRGRREELDDAEDAEIADH
jgi:hypothetical protein